MTKARDPFVGACPLEQHQATEMNLLRSAILQSAGPTAVASLDVEFDALVVTKSGDRSRSRNRSIGNGRGRGSSRSRHRE
jgi:hypothetical protein